MLKKAEKWGKLVFGLNLNGVSVLWDVILALVCVCVCVRECVDPCLINQHLQIRTPRSLLVAHWAKIKTSVSSPFHPLQPSWAFISHFFFSSCCLLTLPAFPSPLGTRQRFALITELLFTPVEKDGDTHQTTTPAHCYAPSIPALPFMHFSPCVCVPALTFALCFIFVKLPLKTPHARSLLIADTQQNIAAVKNAKLIKRCLLFLARYDEINDADFEKNLDRKAQSQRMCD